MRKREGNKDIAILDAAVKVFAQYGYHRAKITAIAELAHIATGSVYLYYKNKEDILLTIFDKLWSEMTQTMKSTIKRIDIEPPMKLDLIVDQLFSMFIANPSLAAVFVNEQHQLIRERRGNIAKHYDDFFDLGEDIIREGMKKKMFTSDVDVKLFRYFIIGGIREVLRQWSQQTQSFPLDRIRQNVKHFIKQGLLPK